MDERGLPLRTFECGGKVLQCTCDMYVLIAMIAGAPTGVPGAYADYITDYSGIVVCDD